MSTTCDIAEYIVENADAGRTNKVICLKVLKAAFSLVKHFQAQAEYNTTGEIPYSDYITGGEETPDYTNWAVSWLFEKDSFPNELPRSWNGNPIIDTEIFLPDMMNGLREAAQRFVDAHCGEGET